jgi:hypothetical protein
MFRYRVHLEDGSDAGEATYAQMIPPATRSTSAPASASACSTWSRSMKRTSRRSSGCYRSRPHRGAARLS